MIDLSPGTSTSVLHIYEMEHITERKLLLSLRICSGLQCQDRSNPVRRVFGVWRLVTPRLVEVTSAHVNCSSHPTDNEFAPILQTQNDRILSHWDKAFMLDSIMSPNIGLPHLTRLDNMTLAVFEDTGWYQVNYDFSDVYLWGKNGGCDFGMQAACDDVDSPYYCQMPSRGCQIQRYDKAVCQTDPFLHGCQVYKAADKDSCSDTSSVQAEYTGEIFLPVSRCFLANITKVSENMDFTIEDYSPEGRCYATACVNGSLYVQIESSPYFLCPWGQRLQVPGFSGIIQCPPDGSMCTDRRMNWTSNVLPVTQITTTVIPAELDPMGQVCLDIFYSSVIFRVAVRNQQQYLNCNLDTILKVTQISRERLIKYSLFEADDGSLGFRVILLPAQHPTHGPFSAQVISRLRDVVNSGGFKCITLPYGPTHTATRIETMSVGPVYSDNKLSTGTIIGAAFGAFLGAIILSVLVYVTQRHYARHSPRNHNQNYRVPNSLTYQSQGGDIGSVSQDELISSIHGQFRSPMSRSWSARTPSSVQSDNLPAESNNHQMAAQVLGQDNPGSSSRSPMTSSGRNHVLHIENL